MCQQTVDMINTIVASLQRNERSNVDRSYLMRFLNERMESGVSDRASLLVAGMLIARSQQAKLY